MKNVTVTLDEDTAAFGAVTVRSSFTLQVSEAGAMYAVERRAANVHRPRGRPRRAAAPA
jgi:hypothetical protein